MKNGRMARLRSRFGVFMAPAELPRRRPAREIAIEARKRENERLAGRPVL